jgi:hypothetical protein
VKIELVVQDLKSLRGEVEALIDKVEKCLHLPKVPSQTILACPALRMKSETEFSHTSWVVDVAGSNASCYPPAVIHAQPLRPSPSEGPL